jgi:YtoQ family protein
VAILGAEPNKFWHDHKGAMVNAIRTRNGIERPMSSWCASARSTSSGTRPSTRAMRRRLGKSLIVLHMPEHQHALKEVHAAALAVAEEPEQVVDILRYSQTRPGLASVARGDVASPLHRGPLHEASR